MNTEYSALKRYQEYAKKLVEELELEKDRLEKDLIKSNQRLLGKQIFDH